MLSRLETLFTRTSLEEIAVPGYLHFNSNGESPLTTTQLAITKSPAFMGPSPKEKGLISGKTEIKNNLIDDFENKAKFS